MTEVCLNNLPRVVTWQCAEKKSEKQTRKP